MRAHVNELKSSTFRVHHGGKTIGTAFSVKGSEYLLTASHVVSNPAGISYPGISVVDAIGKEHPIEIAGNDKGSDIAILKSSAFPRSNGLALGNYAEVEEGDEVLLCGFPFGTEYHVTHRGMVSAKSIINGRQSLQVDASVNKGNSGGPCVAVIDGELKVVGIICTRVVAADLSTFRREHKNIIDSHPGTFGSPYVLRNYTLKGGDCGEGGCVASAKFFNLPWVKSEVIDKPPTWLGNERLYIWAAYSNNAYPDVRRTDDKKWMFPPTAMPNLVKNLPKWFYFYSPGKVPFILTSENLMFFSR